MAKMPSKEKENTEHDIDEREIEIRKLQEIAQLSSIYYRDLLNFERNPHLSHVVHAVMNFIQVIEIFHFVHHAINERMKEKDPEVPDLPEGRNPVFFVYPICMVISLALGILWLSYRNFRPLIEMTLTGCAAGIIMMILAGVVEMRHAEIYINLEKISDAELTEHPVFLHNFCMSIISLLVMLFYLIHFWLTFDCWQWRKKERRGDFAAEDSRSRAATTAEQRPGTSTKRDSEQSADLDKIPPWDLLKKKLSDAEETNFDTEPAILYCFCVDCWRYIRDRNLRKPIHEFQVVHIK